jgi:hypothetical protein
MARAIAELRKGTPRRAGSLGRINLFSHGVAGTVALRGFIRPNDGRVFLADPDPEHPGMPRSRAGDVTLYDDVDLGDYHLLDEAAITWLNSCKKGYLLRDKIRRVCEPGGGEVAELWLVVCHGAGGQGGTQGPGDNLCNQLASTFQVKVRAYTEAVWYWPDYDEKMRVLSRNPLTTLTSLGDLRMEQTRFPYELFAEVASFGLDAADLGVRKRTMEREPQQKEQKEKNLAIVHAVKDRVGIGYYSAVDVVDPNTKKHVGEHLKGTKGSGAALKRGAEPGKEECPGRDDVIITPVGL